MTNEEKLKETATQNLLEASVKNIKELLHLDSEEEAKELVCLDLESFSKIAQNLCEDNDTLCAAMSNFGFIGGIEQAKDANKCMTEDLVIIKKPGETPYPWFLHTGSEDIGPLQELVGGLFEKMSGDAIGLPEHVDAWFCEEGKIMMMEPNIKLSFHGSGDVDDIIAGTAVFIAATEDGGSRSLTDKEVIEVTEWLSRNMI